MNIDQPTCIICTSSANYLIKKDGYNLYKCTGCDLVFVSPLPQKSFLTNSVYSESSGYQKNKIQDLSKYVVTKPYKKIFKYLKRESVNGSLLDIGCSNGEFMYSAKKEGFAVSGVELNSYTAKIAKNNGLNVFIGSLENANFSYGSFDVIFLGDLIEHVEDPEKLVKKCFELLKMNGILIVSTPNMNCFWAKITFKISRVFSSPWSSVTPPYHLFQFSDNNLDILLSKFGFRKNITWFNKRPRLLYELGSTHMFKEYKNLLKVSYSKSFFYSLKMVLVFSLYTILYFITDLLLLLKIIRKDFSMVSVFRK